MNQHEMNAAVLVEDISARLTEYLEAGKMDYLQRQAALAIVKAFDLGSAQRLALFREYYESYDLDTFISILAAFKVTAWTEIGEEPMDKLLELEKLIEEDPVYGQMPPEMLATFLVDGNSVVNDNTEGDDEDDDEDAEEPDLDYSDVRDNPEKFFL